jgi:uncharacterized protein (TIGR02246 family)
MRCARCRKRLARLSTSMMVMRSQTSWRTMSISSPLDLTWLHGRADFEKYHTRLLTGRFSGITHTVLDTDVRFIRSEVAVVRHSWSTASDVNPDGSPRPSRFGLMTMVAEKRNGTWLVVQVQNSNGPTDGPLRSPEAYDIKSPIVVPRPKK